MASFNVELPPTNIPLQESIDLSVELWFDDKLNIVDYTITDSHKLLAVSMFETLVLFDDE